MSSSLKTPGPRSAQGPRGAGGGEGGMPGVHRWAQEGPVGRGGVGRMALQGQDSRIRVAWGERSL